MSLCPEETDYDKEKKGERGDTYFIKEWEGGGKGRGHLFLSLFFLPVLLDKLIRLAAN